MIINLQVQHQRIQGVNKIPRLVIEQSRNFVFLDLDFDAEWDGLTTTVIFSNDHCRSNSAALLWTGKPLEIPEEMLTDGTLRISCVGVGNAGLYVTTKYMTDGIRIHRSGELSGHTPGSTVPGLWEQVLTAVGSLPALNTENKDSLVAAVNEVLAKLGTGDGTSGGTVDTQAIVEQVLNALTTETWTFELEDGTQVSKEVMLR